MAVIRTSSLTVSEASPPQVIRRPRSPHQPRRLFSVASVAGPVLPHGEFPSLELTTQPSLHRLGAQRNSPDHAGHGQPMRGGVGVRQASGVSTQHPVVGVHPAGQPEPDTQQVPASASVLEKARATLSASAPSGNDFPVAQGLRRPVVGAPAQFPQPLDLFFGNRADMPHDDPPDTFRTGRRGQGTVVTVIIRLAGT